MIAMAVLDMQVGASADDVYSSEGVGFSSTSTVVAIGHFSAAVLRINSGYRFTGISGLSGATINVSYISLFGDSGNPSSGTPLTKIFADDAAAPAQIASRADYNSRTPTTAGIDWDATIPANDTYTNSPSTNSVIQELADSYDPTVIQILHKDDGSASTANYIRASSYDMVSTEAPKLHIESTAPAGTTPKLTLMHAG